MIMPFMIIYFRNLNFSFFQIAIITATFSISMFLFEIPTGAFADGFSRKYSVILGFFITAIAVILIPLTTNFYLLLPLWFLAGIGMTFVSGAEESWVIDNLNKYKRKDLHHEFFIKSQSLAAFGVIFAPFIGAVIVKVHSISILWFIFGFGFLLNAMILFLFGKEYYKPKKVKIFEALRGTYKNSKKALKFTVSHKIVFLIILGVLFTGLMVIGGDGFQPFLVSLSMPAYQLGYMYSIMAALIIVTSFLSRLFVRFKPKHLVSSIIFIRMLMLLSLLFIHPPWYIVAAFIFIIEGALSSLKGPILQTYLHKFIPKNIRATVISTKNMATTLVIGLFSLIAGVFLDIFGPQKVLAYGSLFGIFAIIAYLKIKD